MDGAIGNILMSQVHLLENLFVSIDYLISALPLGWYQIKSLFIKATMGTPENLYRYNAYKQKKQVLLKTNPKECTLFLFCFVLLKDKACFLLLLWSKYRSNGFIKYLFKILLGFCRTFHIFNGS